MTVEENVIDVDDAAMTKGANIWARNWHPRRRTNVQELQIMKDQDFLKKEKVVQAGRQFFEQKEVGKDEIVRKKKKKTSLEEEERTKKKFHGVQKTPMKSKRRQEEQGRLTPLCRRQGTSKSARRSFNIGVMNSEVSRGGGGVEGKMTESSRLFGNLEIGQKKTLKTENFPEVASPPHVRGNFSQINLGITRADVLAQNKPENEFVQFVQKDLEVSDWTTPRGLVCTVTSPHTGQSEGLGGTRPSCGRGCRQHQQWDSVGQNQSK